MLFGVDPVLQTLLGCTFTWFVTFLGAAGVIFVRKSMQSLLAASLGFSGGVMTAATFWSLLQPAIDIAAEHGRNGAFYGESFAILPVVTGFLSGAFFVHLADIAIDYLGVSSVVDFAKQSESKLKSEKKKPVAQSQSQKNVADDQSSTGKTKNGNNSSHHNLRQRNPDLEKDTKSKHEQRNKSTAATEEKLGRVAMKRITLLLTAITLHNIPEGLAVGVGFGAAKSNDTNAFAQARNLAVGIGLQNFPEGLAVSLPLRAAGFSIPRALFYGQLSGVVEPIAGIIGCVAIRLVEPLVPFALALAAGAMLYVVVHDVMPEAFSSAAESRRESAAQNHGNAVLSHSDAKQAAETGPEAEVIDVTSRSVSWWFIFGFIVMMLLDVTFTD